MTVSRRKKEKTGLKFRFAFVLLFALASFAVAFMKYMQSAPDDPLADRIIYTEAPAPVTEETAPPRAVTNPVPECEPLDDSYLDTCFFAGDSLIVGLCDYGFIPPENMAAKVGLNAVTINSESIVEADGTEFTAAAKINLMRPENLYILLGMNLLDRYTPDQMLASYGDFVDSIRVENVNIYVISVPPVTAARETDEVSPVLNSDIDKFNSALLKFATDRGLGFLDLNSALKGSDGRLPEELAEADGMHFKKAAYTVMKEYILTHVMR
ncbi:MAG: hypothetical protein IKP75_03255 [Oscillospiraceae bacterium]|nr:hypothetical protein [Oscillospiraceae bacterium]